ncbi:MAG: alkaline phosphatase family protein [Armatimonadota bacterium]
MAGSSGPSRLLVIGIDGADPEVLRRWMDQGELPTLSRLAEQGAWGRLRSAPNLLSAQAWTDFQCGVNAGKHGIFEFQQRIDHDYDVRAINSSDRCSRTAWSLLSEWGRRVAVLNVPLTFPAEPLNGVGISGFPTPSSDSPGFTYPSQLSEHITQRHGGYPLEPNYTACMRRGGAHALCRQLIADMRLKARVARELLTSEDWDCFVHVISESDWAAHYLWHTHDPAHQRHAEADTQEDLLLEVFRAIDEVLRSLLAEVTDDMNVLIVSDHGSGPQTYGNNHLRPLLAALGLLHVRRSAVSSLRDASARLLRGAARLAPRGLIDRIATRPGRVSGHLMRDYMYGPTDWKSTKAFCFRLPGAGRIFVNLSGREPAGTVGPSQMDEVTDTITRELMAARIHDTGEPAVRHIRRGSELYVGPHAHKALDLIVQWQEGHVLSGITSPHVGRVDPEFTGPFHEGRARTGDHREYGTFLACGPCFAAGAEPDDASLTDIAPTLLHVLGHPVPEQMDGRVLEEVLSTDFRSAVPVRRCDTPLQTGVREAGYSREEEEQVKERLADLGYL